jgi:hypothetical protein
VYFLQVIPSSAADKTTKRSTSTTQTPADPPEPTSGGNGRIRTQIDDGNDDEIVRGCIDDSTPLLCENRRPLTYTGTWPVLLCCRENWCNRGVVPTLPAWATDIRGKIQRNFRRPD